MITLIKGTEAACGTDAAGASTFGSATAVRLVNNSGTARLVSVIDSVYPKNKLGAPTTTNLPKNAIPDASKKIKAKSKIKPFKRDRK